MNSLDLLGTFIAAAGIPVIVGSLLHAAPLSRTARARAAAGFAAWLAVVVGLAARGFFIPGRGVGTLAIGAAITVPLSLFALALLVSPRWRLILLALPATLLIALQATRLAGSIFLALHADGRLSAPFAPVAGWGDILVAIVAPYVAWLAYRRRRGWRAVALAWTLCGALDLLLSISLGVMSAADSPIHVFLEPPGSALMGELPWIIIPAYIVPILLCMHAALAYQLVSARTPARSSLAGA